MFPALASGILIGLLMTSQGRELLNTTGNHIIRMIVPKKENGDAQSQSLSRNLQPLSAGVLSDCEGVERAGEVVSTQLPTVR